jgi:hypothetical protein
MPIIMPRELPHPGLPEPPKRGERPRKGATDWSDPDGGRAAAEWLGHVAAGRVGRSGGLSRETRETILATERLLFRRQVTRLA